MRLELSELSKLSEISVGFISFYTFQNVHENSISKTCFTEQQNLTDNHLEYCFRNSTCHACVFHIVYIDSMGI